MIDPKIGFWQWEKHRISNFLKDFSKWGGWVIPPMVAQVLLIIAFLSPGTTSILLLLTAFLWVIPAFLTADYYEHKEDC